MKAGLSLLIAATLVGCSSGGAGSSSDQGSGVRTTTRELNQFNGQKLNGIFLTSIKIGSNQNGTVKLLKVSYGDLLDEWDQEITTPLTLDGTVLSLGSTELSQAGDVRMFGHTTQSGVNIRMRVTGASNAASPFSDVKLYTVEYYSTAGWKPLCDETATSPATPAIATAGYWNLNEGNYGDGAHVSTSSYFNFACLDSAVAKCILAGYRPWSTFDGGLSLKNHHEACTRMIRADYCGDGLTQTTDGIMIDLWDGLGIQSETAQTWNFEAVWTTTGASCVDAVRYYGDPWCVSTCGSNPQFSSTNLLMNRFE